MLAYGRQKPAFSHFVARIFKKILAEQLAHFDPPPEKYAIEKFVFLI